MTRELTRKERTALEMECGRAQLRMRPLLDKYPGQIKVGHDPEHCCMVVTVKGNGGEVRIHCPKGFVDDIVHAQLMLVLE